MCGDHRILPAEENERQELHINLTTYQVYIGSTQSNCGDSSAGNLGSSKRPLRGLTIGQRKRGDRLGEDGNSAQGNQQ